jgi:hypothetical protein|tara:strand:+ start:1902 stop:2105 length:204 start_codon:yes stop_codon:yes gene_type:complete
MTVGFQKNSAQSGHDFLDGKGAEKRDWIELGGCGDQHSQPDNPDPDHQPVLNEHQATSADDRAAPSA